MAVGLDEMIFEGPFQLIQFCDSTKCCPSHDRASVFHSQQVGGDGGGHLGLHAWVRRSQGLVLRAGLVPTAVPLRLLLAYGQAYRSVVPTREAPCPTKPRSRAARTVDGLLSAGGSLCSSLCETLWWL